MNRISIITTCMLFGMSPVISGTVASNDIISSYCTQIVEDGRLIEGTVVDSKSNEPLIGVTIMVEGTTNGTVSDENGKFSINVDDSSTLIFSYIGYTDKKVLIGNKNRLNVELDVEDMLLDEVVVVGYGTQKKVNLTGAVASVKFDDKSLSRPVTTVSSLLSGMVAGLNIMQTSSKPNSESASILIRGNGTLNDSSPLILVDGMEMSLNNVNPNDIESISVLKDAASCAIYGNRGANGVILVTTKKGERGKASITYSGKLSYNTPANLIERVSNYADYMTLMNESATNVGQSSIFSDTTIEAWRNAEKDPNGISESGYPNYVAYPNTDWYDVVYNPKIMQEHSLSLIGGENKTKYSVSLSYVDNPGLVDNSGMKKYYMRSNIETELFKHLTVGFNAWGYHTDQERNNVDDLNGLQMKKSTPGTYPYYDGKYGTPEALEEDPSSTNPAYFLNNSGGYYKTTKFFVNPYLKLKLPYHFNLSTNFYYDNSKKEHLWNNSDYRERYSFRLGESMSTPPSSEVLSEYAVKSYHAGDRSWKNTTTLDWSYKFKKSHDITFLLGYEEFRKWGNTLDVSKIGMIDTELTDFDALTEPQSIDGSSYEYSSKSVFGRLTYAYKSKYLFEANLRYDGSSRFSPENRWGAFPSFSAAWRVSEEKFLKDINWLDNLKLRLSWGQLGNNSIGNYEWQATYATAPHYVFGGTEVPGIGIGTFANYNLRWERTTVQNLGLDLSVLNNRLVSTIDVYNKTTDGILYTPTLSPSLAGFGAPRQNIAEVKNKGVEITLSWQDRINDFSYYVSGNFSYNKNLVSKYKGSLERGWIENEDGTKEYVTNIGEVSTGDVQRVVEGHMINEFYVLNVYKGNGQYFNADGTINPNGGPKDGMIRTEQDMQWLREMTDAGYKFYPNQGIGKDKIWYGDIIYQDMDGDGVYGDDDDREFQGYSKTPKYYFGFQANMSWKGFDISMNWAGAAGFKINWFENGENSTITTFGYGLGKDVAYDHYFYDPENPDDVRTNINSENPRLTLNKSAQVSEVSQFHLHNGNYLKLKNLTIGYTIPASLTKKAYIQNARIYLSGENLLTITKFKGIDPEMATGVGYAPMRQYVLGVNLTF